MPQTNSGFYCLSTVSIFSSHSSSFSHRPFFQLRSVFCKPIFFL